MNKKLKQSPNLSVCFWTIISTLLIVFPAILTYHEAEAHILFKKEITISLPIFGKPATTKTPATTEQAVTEESTTEDLVEEFTTAAPPGPPTLPPQAYENLESHEFEDNTITKEPTVNEETTTVAIVTENPSSQFSPDEEVLANTILERLESIEKKVDALQKSLQQSQNSQTEKLQEIQSKTEEQLAQLQAILGALKIPGLDKSPLILTTTEEPFDVDIRSRQLLPKLPTGGLPSLPSSLPSLPSSLPSVPSSVKDLTQKLPQVPKVPNLLSGGEESDPTTDDGLVEETSPANNSSSFDFENYVPDVGLISDDPDLIRFLLFKSKNPEDYQVLEYKNLDSILSSDYDSKKPVKFLVHGFQQNYNSSYPQNVKNAYLSRHDSDLNVIVVDWGLLSIPNAPFIAPVFYPWAVKNVWRTGERLGEFISWLNNETLIDINKVHIIGFSLGSHVSGKAGHVVQQTFNQSISRVTALDPAGPEFYTGLFARQMEKTDGQYVDAIHTNAGQLGIWANVAQVDFYINGGSLQPGCIGFDSVKAVFKSVTRTVSGSCSHNMATRFFAQTILAQRLRTESDKDTEDSKLCACSSITNYKLGLCKCETKVLFGAHSPHGTIGTFYLDYKLPDLKD